MMSAPQKLLVPIVGALAGCLGFGAGILARQPEINALHNQVRELQKRADALEGIVSEQNDELEGLIARYRALKAWNVFQRSDLRDRIGESLTFQYAVCDYFSIMLERLETRRKLDEGELAFYSTFTIMLDGGDLDESQMQAVKSLVLERHGESIARMEPCDTSEAIDRMRDFEFEEKGCLDLTKAGLPKFGPPKLDITMPELPKIDIRPPWGKGRN